MRPEWTGIFDPADKPGVIARPPDLEYRACAQFGVLRSKAKCSGFDMTMPEPSFVD
jgi:hypothetical protein